MIAAVADDLSFVGVVLILLTVIFEPTWSQWFIEAGLLAMALGAGLEGRWVSMTLFLAMAARVAWQARPHA